MEPDRQEEGHVVGLEQVKQEPDPTVMPLFGDEDITVSDFEDDTPMPPRLNVELNAGGENNVIESEPYDDQDEQMTPNKKAKYVTDVARLCREIYGENGIIREYRRTVGPTTIAAPADMAFGDVDPKLLSCSADKHPSGEEWLNIGCPGGWDEIIEKYELHHTLAVGNEPMNIHKSMTMPTLMQQTGVLWYNPWATLKETQFLVVRDLTPDLISPFLIGLNS